MPQVTVSQQMYDALAKIAEHANYQATASDIAMEKLTRILKQERQEWLDAHPGAETIIITDPCSETSLRNICGDHWEICWWAGGCWLPH